MYNGNEWGLSSKIIEITFEIHFKKQNPFPLFRKEKYKELIF